MAINGISKRGVLPSSGLPRPTFGPPRGAPNNIFRLKGEVKFGECLHPEDAYL